MHALVSGSSYLNREECANNILATRRQIEDIEPDEHLYIIGDDDALSLYCLFVNSSHASRAVLAPAELIHL